MTYEKPVVSDEDGALKVNVGEVGNIRISGYSTPDTDGFGEEKLCTKNAGLCRIESYPINDERLSTAWKHEVYRILLKVPADGKTEMIFG
jgi:hypothetical protein